MLLPIVVALCLMKRPTLRTGLPVSPVHGAAAAPPSVGRVGARLRCRGDQRPLPAAEAPKRCRGGGRGGESRRKIVKSGIESLKRLFP